MKTSVYLCLWIYSDIKLGVEIMKYKVLLVILSVVVVAMVGYVLLFDQVDPIAPQQDTLTSASDAVVEDEHSEPIGETEPVILDLCQVLLEKESPCIVLLGDSITAGVGSSDYHDDGDMVLQKSYEGRSYDTFRNTGVMAWAARFEEYLENEYPGCEVINNGIPSFAFWQLSDSVDELIPEGCDVAVIQIGTNARMAEDKERLIVEPLMDVIDHLKDRGIVPVVMTNTILLDQVAPNDEYTVCQYIQQACSLAGVQCYDVLSEMDRMLLEQGMDEQMIMADQLHPNDLGHEMIFDIYKMLLQV